MNASTLSGDIGFANAHQLWRSLPARAAADTVDLSAVQRMDSSGVALLLELARRSAPARLRLVGPSAQVRQLIGFLEVEALFDMDVGA